MILYAWMMVQIIAECLPISSSGHVALLHNFFLGDLQQFAIIDLKNFDDCVQGANALVFLIYFFTTWWQLVVQRPIYFSALFDWQIWKQNILPVLRFGFIVDAITVIFWQLDIASLICLPLAVGFFITAGALYSLRFAREKNLDAAWSIKTAVMLGLVQSLALLPGISRFATTTACLQWLGYERRQAWAISFLVQWPLLVAASIKSFYALQSCVIMQSMLTVSFLVAILFASCAAYVVMSVMNKIIHRNCMWKFSYYMIIPGLLALFV